jgi:hypothetical protein
VPVGGVAVGLGAPLAGADWAGEPGSDGPVELAPEAEAPGEPVEDGEGVEHATKAALRMIAVGAKRCIEAAYTATAPSRR